MGQVIDKTVEVLKLVAAQKHCSLKSLCAVTGYKKSALCQQLQSMVNNGLLLRDTAGEYHLGPLFSDLTARREENMLFRKTAESIANDLNTACGGDITIATVRNGKYRRLFSCTSLRVTRLTANAPDEECFYGNATGRVLLAEASPELRTRIICSIGLPSDREWSKATGDRTTLLEELKKIREQGFATVLKPGQCFIAAGCTIGKSGLPVAVGISVPASFFDEKKLRKLLQQALTRFDFTTHHTTQRRNEHV